MGQGNSRQEPPVKCFEFPKRLASQSTMLARVDVVTSQGFAGGLKLSWLVTQLASLPSTGAELTIQRAMEAHILPLSALAEGVSLGPATHVALVHPSVPWTLFVKAILNFLGIDPKRALSAGEIPLSPRSPLLPFSPSSDCKAHHAGLIRKCTGPEAWAYDGLFGGSADHAYHSTFLHIGFLSASAPLTAPTTPAPAATTLWHPASYVAFGDTTESVLSHMPGEPMVVLVVDPAGAIFKDANAVRAIVGTLPALRHPARPADPQSQHLQQQQQSHSAADPLAAKAAASVASVAGTTGAGGRLPRLHLASALGGADWAAVSAAFRQVAGLLPDDPVAARAVCEAVLESARLQYNVRWPLLHLFCSRLGFFLDVDCSSVNNPTGGVGSPVGDDGGGGGGGAAGGWETAAVSAAPRHLLPGQIETAETVTIDLADADMDGGGGDGDGDGGGDTADEERGGGGGRGQGPDSQGGIARFPRDLFDGPAALASPPTMPPDGAQAASLVRRSRSLTEGAFGPCASAHHIVLCGRSSGSATPAARWLSLTSGGSGADAAASGVSSTPVVAVPPAPHSLCAGSALSAISAGSTTCAAAVAAPASLTSPGLGGGVAGGGFIAAAPQCSNGCGAYAAANASVASSACGNLEGTGHLVEAAVEAARRYAALLEAVGLWAAAGSVLEACVYAVGERWGHRSRRMAALLMQLGRLQGLQGLYRAAEVTWRQALEALDSLHGLDGVPVLQCRVELAQVLAQLREPEAEAMMRGALAALDRVRGPAAPETLAAREALGSFLVQEGRWAEAEVLLQGLLQAIEEAPPPPLQQQQQQQAPSLGPAVSAALHGQGGGAEGGTAISAQSQQQHRSFSRAVSQELPRVRSQQQLQAYGGVASAGMGRGRSDVPSGSATAAVTPAAAVPPRRSDSRSRVAWGAYPSLPGPGNANPSSLDVPAAAAGSAAGVFSPGHGGGLGVSCTHQRTALPSWSDPLLSRGVALDSTSSPVRSALVSSHGGSTASSRAVATSTSPTPAQTSIQSQAQTCVGGGARVGGPGNADPMVWSGAAATLADVIAAVGREYGGMNELYDGMHLAGPEGTTAADLAAVAAVCPRSGACLAAVVHVRRLTDAGALYDAALAARRAAVLDAAHPAMLDLQLQYARYLSSAGEHGRAEAICRAALGQLIVAPPPCLAARRPAAVGHHHPAEVALRHALGSVLLSAGSLAGAAAELTATVEVAERLVAAGDLAAADARRVEALESLSGVLWQRAQGGDGGSDGGGSAAAVPQPPKPLCHATAARAIEVRRQALELVAVVCGERHERVMHGLAALGQMLEAAGDLAAAERAFEAAAEVALHRHSRLSGPTKAIFRQLQRVYQAQGRTEDAQVLEHMYRLKGGLLSAPPPSPPPQPRTVQTQA